MCGHGSHPAFVAHLAVLGVDPDEGLDVHFLLQLPQRLDEAVCYLSGYRMTCSLVCRSRIR